MNPFLGDFRKFLRALLAIFLFTWVALVVFPWLELGHLPPIQLEGDTDIVPFNVSGLAHAGEHVYAVNGCAYCHTQQVRPASSGADITRGWGTAKDADGKDVTRRTYPRDYIWQGQTFLGNSRDGADLSNVGARWTDAAKLYAYLYHPEDLDPHSSMPAFKFLFITQKISGQPAADALVLPDGVGAPPGYEIVPSADAKALVAYLLSLKKGYHLPQDEAGVPYVPPAPGNNS
ncbi:MAG: cbb3-type cytochrome c oxidase subunit II [Verrucomicrobiota bacterium]